MQGWGEGCAYGPENGAGLGMGSSFPNPELAMAVGQEKVGLSSLDGNFQAQCLACSSCSIHICQFGIIICYR